MRIRALTEVAGSFRSADAVVLCYHRVRSRERFASQMAMLAARGYAVLSLPRFTEWVRGDGVPCRPAALLTFDHCYDDQLENALVVLDELKLPATFFPVSAAVSGQHVDGRDWGRTLRGLIEAGHAIGCHTQTHPVLPNLTTREIRRELLDSRRALEDVLGQAVSAFCYPYGAYDARVSALVREAGFDLAFTVDFGGVMRGDDPYRLRRAPVLGEPPSTEFKLYLSGHRPICGALLLSWKVRERFVAERAGAAATRPVVGSGVESAVGVERAVGDYARISSLNRRKLAKLGLVLRRLHEQGVGCIVLKGADLIPRLYGVFGARALGDADLLVREADLPAIDRVVRDLGYRPQSDGNPVYVDPEEILALDVLTKVWYVDDQEAIWRRAVSRELDGVPMKAMAANDLVLYLTAFSVIHRGHLSPDFARDIGLLLAREPIDWDFVVNEAARCHLRVALHHGLSFVVAHQPSAPVPDTALARLAPAGVGEWLGAWCLRRLATGPRVPELGHLLLFLTRPGRGKLRWLRDVFVPSPAFLGYRYGVAGVAHPVRTRLGRGVTLVLRAQLLLARVAARLVWS